MHFYENGCIDDAGCKNVPFQFPHHSKESMVTAASNSKKPGHPSGANWVRSPDEVCLFCTEACFCEDITLLPLMKRCLFHDTRQRRSFSAADLQKSIDGIFGQADFLRSFHDNSDEALLRPDQKPVQTDFPSKKPAVLRKKVRTNHPYDPRYVRQIHGSLHQDRHQAPEWFP